MFKYYTLDEQFIKEEENSWDDRDVNPANFTGIIINYLNHKCWFVDGEHYRENDLPATECEDGRKYWFQNGKYHRLNGPAVVYPDNTHEYWIFGKELKNATPESFKLYIDLLRSKGLL